MSYHIGIDARFWGKETGGLGRYGQNLVKELAALDTQNRYTVILTPEDESQFVAPAANFKKLVVPIPYYSIGEQKKLAKVLNEQNFDLVHFTHFSHPILYRKPFVVTVHDLIMHLFPTGRQQRSLLRRLAYKMVMNDTRRAKEILVPSQSTKNDLVAMLHFPEKQIAVTPEGSSEGFRPHTAAEITAIKKKYDLPDRFLLFVSRWERYKGLDALLEVFEQLSPLYPDLGLVISGKPSKQRPEIGDLVANKQAQGLRIITPGFIDDADLAALYSAATMYVHPSWYEGFGIMILEAFASGVPVITSNISSMPEVVGDAGLLVNPYSTGEIKEAIVTVLNDPKLAASLSQKGLERVKQYSWKHMAELTHASYLRALAASKAS